MRMTKTILLYEAEVWGGSMQFQKYRLNMKSVRRQDSLRVYSAYRTVSAPDRAGYCDYGSHRSLGREKVGDLPPQK